MYVKNDYDELIYEVRFDKRDIVDYGDEKSYMIIKLDLVCGKDWVDVNSYGGTMGWIPAEYFTDEVQFESCVCYFYTESVISALEENGYIEVKKLPKIEKPRE